jgi:hypothetical protein
MYLVQILLPRADNSGQPFSHKDFDRVTNELAQRFEGVTAYIRAPAEGVWKHDQKLSSDDIVVLEVMTEKVDLAEWSERRQQYEKGFRQEKVIVRYMAISLV